MISNSGMLRTPSTYAATSMRTGRGPLARPNAAISPSRLPIASASTAMPMPSNSPFSSRSKLSKTGRQLNWYIFLSPPSGEIVPLKASGSEARAVLVSHPELNGEANRRWGQFYAEEFQKCRRVRVELDAGHPFMQDGVDKVQPDRISGPYRRRICRRRPAVVARLVLARILPHQPAHRRIVDRGGIHPVGIERQIGVGDRIELQHFRIRHRGMNDALRIDVLQYGNLDLFSPFGEIERAVMRAALWQQRSHAFAVVRNRKVRQLRA